MNRFDHTRTFLCVITMIMLLIFLSSCQTSKQSQGTNPAHHDTVVIDKDGNRYPVKRLKDNHLWMTANLKLNTRESYYYNDSSHYNERYGRLYTWAAAQQGCASLGEGWRLPTRDEWYRLAENYGALGREEPNIEKRAYLPLLAGGSSQFDAVLGGGRKLDGSYARGDAHGFYWTITPNDSATAWFANFGKGSQALFIQPDGEIKRAFAVRCVKSVQDVKR